MTVVLLLLALSALIGFGVGTSFRWPAIAASSVGIAVLSSAALQIQSFSALPGIAIVIACLTVSQMSFVHVGDRRIGPRPPRQGRQHRQNGLCGGLVSGDTRHHFGRER
jgi:hypothetical protein